mmetsp:Transcript_51631/g.165288  ORF Transcript_51631/g.165288 Transcript_51631/m.165288 type:complete len:408 (+) Transcript_51631:480-1703(+)
MREGFTEEPERDVDLDVHGAHEGTRNEVRSLATLFGLLLLLSLEPKDAVPRPLEPVLPGLRDQSGAVLSREALREEIFHEVPLLAILARSPVAMAVVGWDDVVLLQTALPHADCGALLWSATHKARTLRHDLLHVLAHGDCLVDEGAVLHFEERHGAVGVHLQNGLAAVLEVGQVDEALVAPDGCVGHAFLPKENLDHQRIGCCREGVVVSNPGDEAAGLAGSDLLGPAADERYSVADRQHHLLQLRVVTDPLVELADGIPKVTASGLGIEVRVRVRVAVVQHIVTDDHARRRQKPMLQNELHIALVLGLVGVHEDKVKLAVQLRQRIQRRSHDDLVSVCNRWEPCQARGEPILEVWVNLQRNHMRSWPALEHCHGAVAHEHANLEHSPRLREVHQLLQQHRLQRVR